MKSQFVTSGGFDSFLCTSLGCVGIDGRSGISPEAQKDIQAMKNFAAANPKKVDPASIEAWVEKVCGTETKTAAPARGRNGMNNSR